MRLRMPHVQRRDTRASSSLFAEASTLVPGCTPAEVWALIRPAESAVLLQDDVVQAFTVPGTGPGKGEQQCFVRTVGDRRVVDMLTVTAEEPARFAEAVDVLGEVEWRMRWDVAEVPEGTRLTARCWAEVPVVMDPAAVASWRDTTEKGQEAYLSRVTRTLAARSQGHHRSRSRS